MRRNVSKDPIKVAAEAKTEKIAFSEDAKNFVVRFLQLYSQFYIFHWQTKSYAQHIAFDEANADLLGLADGFVESYQGKYGRVGLGGVISFELADTGVLGQIEFVRGYRDFLLMEGSEFLVDKDGDLQNIIDEMIARLNKLLYLLTLN